MLRRLVPRHVGLPDGDIRGTLALWRLIEKRIGWDGANRKVAADFLFRTRNVQPNPVWSELTLETENEVARIIWEQEQDGVRFDRERAITLIAELQNQQAHIRRDLVARSTETSPPRCGCRSQKKAECLGLDRSKTKHSALNLGSRAAEELGDRAWESSYFRSAARRAAAACRAGSSREPLSA
ncbi:UNVERIFIED_ORG: hypothetical protein M2438_005087 [Methylobacterium sp. SuP10 SLI 274]|nr:hypothetical protein [Methylorubrum extorquens]MDF9794662.1 hypothetical protein [Methylorubrum extorquens]MDF9866372.1 hypothetical protein [Methylorubrum pseudosasae]MDH6639912.1 hypothetical protein [Methylobacterium sp. SuP10 SLI 274]MDH6669105.1 hypothetical protein [Methylorubrum zatmanii]